MHGTGLSLLLLEDDADLGRAVADHLQAAGHQVQWVRRMADLPREPAPALALIDLHLPDGDGLVQLRQWRASGCDWPVIVLTARDQVSDRIRGLQAGADDYLVKPFDLDELLARVQAVHRRSTGPAGVAAGAGAAGAGSWRLDLDAHTAWCDGAPVDLTQMEWNVLGCLAKWPGRIYSRGEIEARLLAQGMAEASSNSLEVIISRLRKKLGTAAISTHRGLGYRLELPLQRRLGQGTDGI